MQIIGRKYEQQVLQNCHQSGKPEFVAIYGRRRIGKTFLVRQFFRDTFDFSITGIYQGTRQEQLVQFCKLLNQYSKSTFPIVNNWFDAFDQLKTYLSHIKKKRIVVFIDELPWLDTPKSRFINAFEAFWNGWGAHQQQLMLVVCGSATTWMTQKLIGNKGGLHNRLTRSIYLSPFTLGECEKFLANKGMKLSRYEQVENYMIMGGTPYYLNLLEPGLSLSQNIDRLFFAKNAPLRTEYNFLFRSLFNDSELYQKVVECVARKAKGLTLIEIKAALGAKDSGKLSQVISNLCSCDLMTKYYAYQKKQRDALYQLTDLYTLFYLRFVHEQNSQDEHQWTNMLDNPKRTAWSGYAFEQVCFHHINQIKRKLGILGVLTQVCSWQRNDGESHEQIDMVIDRNDRVTNLCEMKYSRAQYEITRQYINHLNNRLESFRNATRSNKALHLTMVTTYGIKPGIYSGLIQSEVTMDDLFEN